MRTKFISAAIIFAACSGFTSQASAVTTIDLKDFDGTLINNSWFGTFQPPSVAPFETINTAGDGSIFLAPIVNNSDSSHIHVNGGNGIGSNATPFIHGDVGGVFIDGTGTLDKFSFQSMDILHSVLQSDSTGHPNATITVRGFLGGINNMMTGVTEADGITMLYNGGSQVATATLLNGVTGTFDFLAADSGFDEVDYVEFFFTDFYRLKPSSLGDTALDFEFDNIVVGEAGVSAVPVPAAVWLFGTGLIGLSSFGKRKQKAVTA